MLKTLSAAFLAASVIAAPAFATEPAKDASKTTTAPVIKADQTQAKTTAPAAVKPEAKPQAKVDGKTETRTDVKSDAKTGTKSEIKSDVKSDKKADATAKAMNANAAVLPSEHKAVQSHRHHRKLISSKKTMQPGVAKPVVTEKKS